MIETKEARVSQMIESLRKNGFVWFNDCSETDCEIFLRGLGEVIQVTNVIVKPDSKALVTSARGLDFHTDHHRAKYILWHCIKQTDKGGESILVDAEKVYRQLSAEHRQALKSILLFEHKVFPDDAEHHPLVTEDETGNRKFYYSFWLVRKEEKHHPAVLAFQEAIRATPCVTIKLRERDILIVDNHRIFHGRTPIAGSKDRFLRRYWIASTSS